MASQALARLVWQRARARYEYCRTPQEFDPLPFQIDHIIARKHRGRTRLENLALACFACNNHKDPNIAGIDPDTHAVTPLFHPRHDAGKSILSGMALNLSDVRRLVGRRLPC